MVTLGTVVGSVPLGTASQKQNWCDFQSSLCSSRVFSISQVVQDLNLNGSAESASYIIWMKRIGTLWHQKLRVQVRHSHKTHEVHQWQTSS